MEPAIIVHGGAGAWNLKSHRLEEAKEACRAAAAAGRKVLLAGGSALDAVETAVNILEDAPMLDAGRGSYLNANGDIEMDALIMDGSDLNHGGNCGRFWRALPHQPGTAHVMTDSEHTFIVGKGAEAFADSIGFPRCAVEDLLVGDRIRTVSRITITRKL